jgi:hypothetical protein
MGVAKLFLTDLLACSKHPRTVFTGSTVRFPTPPLQPIHASLSHFFSSPYKHTFRGVGDKTLQDSSKRNQDNNGAGIPKFHLG